MQRPGSRLAAALPIVGRVEWTIERQKASWWPAWAGEAQTYDASSESNRAATTRRTRSLKLSKGLAPLNKPDLRIISAPVRGSIVERSDDETSPQDAPHQSPTVESDHQGSRHSSVVIVDDRDQGRASARGSHASSSHNWRQASGSHHPSQRSIHAQSQQSMPGRESHFSGYTALLDGGEGEDDDEDDDDQVTRRGQHVDDQREVGVDDQSEVVESNAGRGQRRSKIPSRHVSKASMELRRQTQDFPDISSLPRQRQPFDIMPDADESMWQALRDAPRPPAEEDEDEHNLEPPQRRFLGGRDAGHVTDWIQRTAQSPDLLRDRSAFVQENINHDLDEQDEDDDANLVPPQDDVKDVLELWAANAPPSQAPSQPASEGQVYGDSLAPVQTTPAPQLLSPIALDDMAAFGGAPPQLGNLSSSAASSTAPQTRNASLDVSREGDEAPLNTSLKPPRSPGDGSTRSNSTEVSGLEDFERALELLSPVGTAHANSPSLAAAAIGGINGKKMSSRDSLAAARTLSTSVAPSPRWLASKNRGSAQVNARQREVSEDSNAGRRPVSSPASAAAPSARDFAPRTTEHELTPRGQSGKSLDAAFVFPPGRVPVASSPLRAFASMDDVGAAETPEEDAPVEAEAEAEAATTEGEPLLNGQRSPSVASAEQHDEPASTSPEQRDPSLPRSPQQVPLDEQDKMDEPPQGVSASSSSLTLGAETEDGDVAETVDEDHEFETDGDETQGSARGVGRETPTYSYDTTWDSSQPPASQHEDESVETGTQHDDKRRSDAGARPESRADSVVIYDSPGSASSIATALRDERRDFSEPVAEEEHSQQPHSSSSDPDATMQPLPPRVVDFDPCFSSPATVHRSSIDADSQRSSTHSHSRAANSSPQESHFWKHTVVAPPNPTTPASQASTDSIVTPVMPYLTRAVEHEGSGLSPQSAAGGGGGGSNDDNVPPSIERMIRGQSFSASSVAVTPERLLTPTGADETRAHDHGEGDEGYNETHTHTPIARVDSGIEASSHDDNDEDPAGHYDHDAKAPRPPSYQSSDAWSQEGSRYSRFYDEHLQSGSHSGTTSGLSRAGEYGPDTPSFYLEQQLDDSRPSSFQPQPQPAKGTEVNGSSHDDAGLEGENIGLGLHPGPSPLADEMPPDDQQDVSDDLDAMLSSINAFNSSERGWSRPSSLRSRGTASPQIRAESALRPSTGPRGDVFDDHDVAAMTQNTRAAVRSALTNSERFAHEQRVPSGASSSSGASLTSSKSMTNLQGHGQSLAARRSLSPHRRASIGELRLASGGGAVGSPKVMSAAARFATLPPSPSVGPGYGYGTAATAAGAASGHPAQPMSPLSTAVFGESGVHGDENGVAPQ